MVLPRHTETLIKKVGTELHFRPSKTKVVPVFQYKYKLVCIIRVQSGNYITESFQNYGIEVQCSICSLDNICNQLNEYIDYTAVYDLFFHTPAFRNFYRIRPFLNGHFENVKAPFFVCGPV